MRPVASILAAVVLVAGCGGASSSTVPVTPAPVTAAPPIATPTTAAAPTLPGEGPVTAGTYALDPGLGVTIDVPAGWSTCCEGMLTKTDFAALLYGHLDGMDVYTDPCLWKAGSTRAVGADAIAAALSAQPHRNGSEPRNVTVAGLPGVHVRLSVPQDQPTDANGFTGCDEGEFKTDAGRFHQAPGQIDDFYLVDLGDGTFAFDVVSGPDIPAADKADLEAMVASARIG